MQLVVEGVDGHVAQAVDLDPLAFRLTRVRVDNAHKVALGDDQAVSDADQIDSCVRRPRVLAER